MAYLSAEDVKHIRVALKKEFPQYKFSVTRDHHLGVNINFMEGPRFAEYEYFDKYTHETRWTILMVIIRLIIFGLKTSMVKKMQKS